MAQKCERCGQKPLSARSYGLLDYCAGCLRNLCDGCMGDGCCDKKPAESGMESDFADD